MRPPDTLARLPRDMEKHFKNLKASELQAWLLYYSLPCLVGILPDIYLQHFAQFSEGIYILLGDSITPNQLSRARDLLLRFYKDFAELYGEGTCGLNVHNAGQHLADYAEGWGPLWAWSTFGFEDMNGTLMDFAHGTGNVSRQLIWMLHAQSRLRCDVNLMENCSIKQFIECMLSTKRQLRSLKKANDCQVAGGTKKVQNLQQPIGEAITRIPGSDAVWMVNRIVVNGHVYFSKQYTRMVKRNACVVQFTDNTLGGIEFFVWEKKSGKVLAIFKEIEVDSNKLFFFNDVGLHAVRVKSDRSELKAKNVTEILEKIMLLNGNSRNHVIIRFPNFNGVCG